ncbi:J domain-containing protein, partial [Chloroflexota bacterium]
MKDYYHILGVPENASPPEIKQAFRKLAFQHHPDTNPGNEEEAEAKFKEINEAYGVLGDEGKRQQYDLARKSQFAGYGQSGFQYSSQDIFRDTFSNRATYEDLNRMFAQAGLRFDQDFLNSMFFGGKGVTFQFFTTPGGAFTRTYTGKNRPSSRALETASGYKPNWLERLLSRATVKIGRFALSKLFGIDSGLLPGQ